MPHNKLTYFPAMHGLRGVLCLWVFLLHLYLLLSLGLKINAEAFFGVAFSKFVWSGYVAVLAFFMLSGFFISHAYLRHYKSLSVEHVLPYLRARLMRIYPVHLFVLLLYVGLVWGTNLPFKHICFPYDPATPCDPFSVEAFFKNLFLIHAWDWFPRASWNVNSWSISSEWAVYLLAPLLIVPMSKLKNGFAILLTCYFMMLGVVLLIPAIPEAQHLHNLFIGVLKATNNPVGAELFSATGPSILEFGLIRASGAFLCGCLMYKVFQSSFYNKLKWHVVGVIATIVIGLFIHHYYVSYCYIVLVPLILSLAQPRGLVSQCLSARPIQWLGDISYSFYMVHGVVIKLLAIAIPYYLGEAVLQNLQGVSIAMLIAAIVAISMLTSAAVYYAIELPCQKIAKRRYAMPKAGVAYS